MLPDKLNSPRSGKIKARIFALILLIFSCSMIISAYRSLSRSFSGLVIRKTATAGFGLTQYHLFLLPAHKASDTEFLTKVLSDATFPLQMVGVSAFVYERAQQLENVEKKGLSFFIAVENTDFIDLGLFWLLLGLSGIAIAIWMHLQTLARSINQQPSPGEELSIPGLD